MWFFIFLVQIEQRRVPVISSLIPFSPHYRMISFVSTEGSRPLCYSVSRYSHSAHGHSHNCTGFEAVDFCTMDTRLPRDVYMDNLGVPYEIGHGQLLSLEYRPNTVHPGATAGISSMTYELILVLSQLKMVVLCYPDLKHYFLAKRDLSSCYEPVDRALVQMALRVPAFMPINDAYETLIRFLSGADHHDHLEMRATYAMVYDHFQEYMQKVGDKTNVHATPFNEFIQTFRLHRLVSVFITCKKT